MCFLLAGGVTQARFHVPSWLKQWHNSTHTHTHGDICIRSWGCFSTHYQERQAAGEDNIETACPCLLVEIQTHKCSFSCLEETIIVNCCVMNGSFSLNCLCALPKRPFSTFQTILNVAPPTPGAVLCFQVFATRWSLVLINALQKHVTKRKKEKEGFFTKPEGRSLLD